ncbi:MAG: hypothetical protein ABR599_06950 [Gemmatimonadota bacterium]
MQHEARYRRWLDEEAEARRLEDRRQEARRRLDQALSEEGVGKRCGSAEALQRVQALEQLLERSLAFYLGHAANDDGFLLGAFGPARTRELGERLATRKLALMNELDRVRETRHRLASDGAGG